MRFLVCSILLLCISAFRTPRPAPPLTLSVDNHTVRSGAEVCVDVRVKHFWDIMSIQYTMKWNPKHLAFRGLKELNLRGLSSQNFGLHKVQEGMLTFSWYDAALRGITLPDGTSIYQMCFLAKAPPGTKTWVRFVDYPTVFEVSNKHSELIGLQPANGTIRIE